MRAHRDCATHHQGRYHLSHLWALFELIYWIFAATQYELYIEVPANSSESDVAFTAECCLHEIVELDNPTLRVITSDRAPQIAILFLRICSM